MSPIKYRLGRCNASQNLLGNDYGAISRHDDSFRAARQSGRAVRPWSGLKALLKFFSTIVLLLALLATQQLLLTHGYTHLGASPGEQVTAQRDQNNPPATLHTCALCAVSSGLHLLSPPPALALPVVVITAQTFAAAVSPAPTFYLLFLGELLFFFAPGAKLAQTRIDLRLLVEAAVSRFLRQLQLSYGFA